jgi:hypothetical protein
MVLLSHILTNLEYAVPKPAEALLEHNVLMDFLVTIKMAPLEFVAKPCFAHK